MSLQQEIIASLIAIEPELGASKITYKSIMYDCTASVVDNTEDLEFGGYKNQTLLNVTVRLLDQNGYLIFSAGEPQLQEKIVFSVDSQNYRIIHIRRHPTGAFLRLLCESVNRGV